MTDRIVFTGLEDEAAGVAFEGGFGNDLLNADDDHGADTSTATDDVYVEGRIITAENYDAALEAQGLEVVVAAATTDTASPRGGEADVNGQGGSDVIIGATAPSLEGGEGFDFVQVNGANTAVADEGATDIVAAPGMGGGPHVRVFDGLTSDTAPFETFTGGVFVAAGDVNGDAAATDLADAGAEAAAFQRNNLGLFTLDIGTTEAKDSFDFVGAASSPAPEGDQIEILSFSWDASSPTAEEASADPVLMVISNQDFWYQDYADTRAGFDDVDIVHTDVFETVDLF